MTARPPRWCMSAWVVRVCVTGCLVASGACTPGRQDTQADHARDSNDRVVGARGGSEAPPIERAPVTPSIEAPVTAGADAPEAPERLAFTVLPATRDPRLGPGTLAQVDVDRVARVADDGALSVLPALPAGHAAIVTGDRRTLVSLDVQTGKVLQWQLP